MERTLSNLPPASCARLRPQDGQELPPRDPARPDRAYDRASRRVRAQPRLKDALRGEPHIAPMRWSSSLPTSTTCSGVSSSTSRRTGQRSRRPQAPVCSGCRGYGCPAGNPNLNPTPTPTPTPTLIRQPNPNPNPNPTPKPKPKPNPDPDADPDPDPALAPAPALTLSGTGGGAPPSGVLRLPQRRQATACAPRLGH